MSELNADIHARIILDFGARAPDAFQLMAQLSQKVTYVDHARSLLRIQHAVVVGAKGDVVRMALLVDLAGADYRDLFMEVEGD
jgi:hypothetical protein